jgi:uncharacterized ParB-like nuclease family protein
MTYTMYIRNLSANVLSTQGKSGDETRGLCERSLAISIRSGGQDGEYAAFGNCHIGEYYQELARNQSTVNALWTHLLPAKFHHEKALRIYSKIYGPTHPCTVDTSSRLTVILRELSQL